MTSTWTPVPLDAATLSRFNLAAFDSKLGLAVTCMRLLTGHVQQVLGMVPDSDAVRHLVGQLQALKERTAVALYGVNWVPDISALQTYCLILGGHKVFLPGAEADPVRVSELTCTGFLQVMEAIHLFVQSIITAPGANAAVAADVVAGYGCALSQLTAIVPDVEIKTVLEMLPPPASRAPQ